MLSTNDQTDRTDRQAPCWEWDLWEREAIERGMSKDLAILGRAVIREAMGHNWSPQLRCLCSEEVLEQMLLKAPRQAKRLCEVLLETDGLRVAWVEDGEKTTSEFIELSGFGF